MPTPDEQARKDETTRLLNRFSSGKEGLAPELLEEIYGELHELAAGHMARQRPGHTLQPTALVGEAFLRIAAQKDSSWESRRQFYAVASKIMRSLLVDHARAKTSTKRGGDQVRIPFEIGIQGAQAEPADIDFLDLHDAMDELAQVDEELSRAVELRYFGGLSMSETAASLGLPLRTTERRLRTATAWLRDHLED